MKISMSFIIEGNNFFFTFYPPPYPLKCKGVVKSRSTMEVVRIKLYVVNGSMKIRSSIEAKVNRDISEAKSEVIIEVRVLLGIFGNQWLRTLKKSLKNP